MQQVRKQSGQPLTATSDTGLQPSCLFYVTDKTTWFRFLVDTGAEVNITPPSPADRKRQDSFTLWAVNHTSIATYGQRSLTLDYAKPSAGFSSLPMSKIQFRY